MPTAAIDSLETERITADAADQRAGRAGRIGAGSRAADFGTRAIGCGRIASPRFHRVDLSATVLDILAWGGNPRTFEWFERPRADAIEAAIELLERLGAVDDGRVLTRRRPTPAVAAAASAPGANADRGRRGAASMARACAMLSERLVPPASRQQARRPRDLLSALDEWTSVAASRSRGLRARSSSVAHRLGDSAKSAACRRRSFGERFSRDTRIASRSGASRGRRASGWRPAPAPRSRAESGVLDGEFLVAVDVQASTRAARPEPIAESGSTGELVRPRLAAPDSSTEVVHRYDSGAARCEPDGRSVTTRSSSPNIRATPTPRSPPRSSPRPVARERGQVTTIVRLLRRLTFAGLP